LRDRDRSVRTVPVLRNYQKIPLKLNFPLTQPVDALISLSKSEAQISIAISSPTVTTGSNESAGSPRYCAPIPARNPAMLFRALSAGGVRATPYAFIKPWDMVSAKVMNPAAS
jgi:hypothetical protein